MSGDLEEQGWVPFFIQLGIKCKRQAGINVLKITTLINRFLNLEKNPI
jgi:hypothetical protein